jgi:phage-related protein
MADIDELQIKIKADSAKASNSIESLVNSMNRLRESISFDTAKLSNIASGIRSISDAATGFKGGKSSEITSIVRALNKFSGVDANSIHGISSAVRDLASGIASVKAVDTSGLISMVSALSKIGGKASTQATKNLPALSAQLQNFVRQMNKIGALNFDMTNMSNLVTAISRLGSVASGRAVTNIPLLADNLKYLFETLSKAPNVSSNIIQMTQALGNLSNRSGGAISGLNTSISSLSGSFLGFKTSTGKALIGLKSFTRQILSSMGIYLGLYGAIRGIKNAIDISSTLTEVQNVVDVTFGDMSKKVNEFAQDSIRQFGMSELTLKQTASRFQAMGTAMGIDSSLIKKANEFLNKQTDGYIGLSDSMADVSLNLTKLTADMASLYNIDQDVVSQDLAAIFTGQTRPLRDYGLDLTQATLKEWAMKQGLDSDIASMSQAEKTMLRYQYVLANTQTAQGDFARTADSWANQIRILKQSFEQLGSVIGGALINAFKPFVKALNSVLLVVISFVTKVTNALGAIFGWKYEDSGAGLADSFSDAAESAGDIADNTGQAAKNIDKMNKGVRQFDELKLITTNDGSGKKGSGGSGGGGASGGASGGKLVKTDTIFKNYESDIKNLKQLGKYISDALSKAMESINWDKIYSKARNFGKGLADFLNGLINPRLFGNVGKTIAGALNTAIYATLSFGQTFDWTNFGNSLAEGINKFFQTFDFASLAETINVWVQGIYTTIKTMIQNISWSDVWQAAKDFLSNLDIETVAIIIGALTIKKIAKTIIGANILNTIGKFIAGKVKDAIVVALGAEKGTGIGTALVGMFKRGIGKFGESVGKILIPNLMSGLSLNESMVAAFGTVGTILAGIVSTVGGAILAVTNFVKMMKDGFSWLNAILMLVGTALAAVGAVILGVAAAPAALVAAIVAAVGTIVVLIHDNWETIKSWFSGVSDWVNEKIFTPISNKISDLWKTVTTVWQNASNWFSTTVIEPIVNFFQGLWTRVKQIFEGLWIIVQAIWITVSGWFNDNVITPVVNFFQGLWISVSGFFKQLWEDVKKIWSKVSKWFNETVVIPVINFFKPIWTKVKEFFSNLWNDIKTIWASVSNWFDTKVIQPLLSVFNGLWSGVKSGMVSAMNAVIGGIESAINFIVGGINTIIGGFNKVVSWAAKVAEVDWGGVDLVPTVQLSRIQAFETGGFPKQYSMFMAGENGVPEILGTVGGKTAVAGGQEITGIRDAVYSTSQQEIALLKQQNQLLSEILKKPMLSNNDVFNAAKSVYKGEAKRRYGDSAAFDPVWG